MLPIDNDTFGVTSIAEAMKWVSIVTSVVSVMLVPALGGIWIDHLLGTKCLFVILGAIVGFVGGMYCLLEMVQGHRQQLHPLEVDPVV
jgi:F0F1-type ATP synthase assembly protein I